MSEINQHYRQGDVYLAKINQEVTPGKRLSPDPARGTVLAYGEVTGHAHTLDPVKTELYELPPGLLEGVPEAANARLLRVLEPVSLRHEEHGPISLEPGDYYIGIQIEYDDMEEWRRVLD
jgi:hypothetical protein